MRLVLAWLAAPAQTLPHMLPLLLQLAPQLLHGLSTMIWMQMQMPCAMTVAVAKQLPVSLSQA